jgi:hypothetical protein
VSVSAFDRGDVVRVTNTITVGGVATDPTTLQMSVIDPSGTQTDYTYAASQLTKSGTGVYYRDLTLSLEGEYQLRFVATGTAAGAVTGRLKVLDDRFS